MFMLCNRHSNLQEVKSESEVKYKSYYKAVEGIERLTHLFHTYRGVKQ